MQYPEWKQKVNEILKIPRMGNSEIKSNSEYLDPTGNEAIDISMLTRKMEMVEETCKLTDPIIWKYLFKAVTEDYSFTYLSTVLDIPVSRDYYYERYRKFFFLLNKIRENI